MIYCGTYMIFSIGKACEVHFDEGKDSYIAYEEIPRFRNRALPEDIERYINQYIPKFRKHTFQIPMRYDYRIEDPVPIDSKFMRLVEPTAPANPEELTDAEFDALMEQNYEFDEDYVREAAQGIIGGNLIGYGSAKVAVRDHPSCTSTYKSVSEESLERLRTRLYELVHPFCQGMILQFEGNTFQVDPEYEPSTNELIFDYKLILE